MTIQEKAVEAVRGLFGRNGYEIIDGLSNGRFDVVARDADEECVRLAYVNWFASSEQEKFESHRCITQDEKNDVERMVIEFVMENGGALKNETLIADRVDLLLVGDSNALIRHRKNVITENE